MSEWTLTLSPSNPTRPSSLGQGWLQLNYNWQKDGVKQTELPPVATVHEDTLTIVYEYHNTVFTDYQVHLTIAGNSPVGPVNQMNGTQASSGGSCSWSFPPLSIENPGFRFRVEVSLIAPDGPVTVYTVDPEMVVGSGHGSGAPPGARQ